MPHHVRIRVIHDDGVKFALLDAFTTVSVIPAADISGFKS